MSAAMDLKNRRAEIRRELEYKFGKGISVEKDGGRGGERDVFCWLPALGDRPSADQQRETRQVLYEAGILEGKFHRTDTDRDGRGWWIFRGMVA
jgi:hypothetical protein